MKKKKIVRESGIKASVDSVASVRRLSLSSSSDKIPLETNKADTMVLQNSKAKSMNGAKSSKESTPVVMNPIDPKTMLFFEAIREGSIQKTKAILRGKNMNMNTRDLNDKNTPTALIVACEVNNTEIVKLLLTMKKARILDVNQEDKVGRRPIWIAAWKGNAEIADLLLNTRGTECDVNFIDKESGTSPLYRAILSNSEETAHLLISAKADVNMRRMGVNLNGAETPLIKAVQMNNKAIVEHLVNALCKIQARTQEGFNALHYCVAYRRYDIAEYLLQNEIKIHAKSHNGITAMTVAIEHHNPAMVKLLIEYGYKMDKRYQWKETPLSQAINLHSEECAMTLIHQGCELKKKRGHSYFMMAVDEKLMKLAKFMAAVQPQFLQQSWVKTKQWPVSIYHRPDIIRWLEQESDKVRSLRQLCRGKIFRLLGKYPDNKLKKLNLTDTLREYVSYKSHVKDEFYVQNSLDLKGECPIECPAICARKYCPPIEFSSSSESDSSIDDDDIDSQGANGHHNRNHLNNPNDHDHDHDDDDDKKCCDYCK
ncbi:receptor-interacting serine/threonine-protein kinase 4-like isoform X1 [Ruditapes philippinarum]|uniref:receptor-interacting serine/threonine-protein kinase 4-like isoform X1 n=2 Tax=Ruditapes philippinarum TaxID=129788 RepID=UPI00295B2BC9|nr:receptor-interacting serine/threonine-protein kinase 4-like isoform X1 [Ruditapes philippinarum]